MKHQDKQQRTSGWLVLLTLVAFGIYAFILSMIGGAIVWLCLEIGLSYEEGIMAVLVFFVLELMLFFSTKNSPAVKATNRLLHPIVFVARNIVRAWPCALSKDFERDLARQLIRSTSKLINPL